MLHIKRTWRKRIEPKTQTEFRQWNIDVDFDKLVDLLEKIARIVARWLGLLYLHRFQTCLDKVV